MHLNRRQFAMAGGAVVASGAMLAGATRTLALGRQPTAVVDRWLNEVVRTGATERIEEFVRPDVVLVMHGVGANPDGTPRRIEGLAALRDWVTQIRSRWVSTPEVRIDDRVVDGGKIAVRGRVVWHRQTPEGRVKTDQSSAAFYYVEAGRLYQIERYNAVIRSATS
jgi:hypothetical protein